jgi:ATP-dependent Clp protease ATP-binding subunit ClpC
MEQFSPEKSRIFAAAAIANIYSSILFVALRIIVAVLLTLFLFVLGTGEATKPFYLTIIIAIVFFVFEIFYQAKILKEKPLTLQNGQVNLADSLTLEAAKLILKTSRVDLLGSIINSLLKNEKVLFAINRADLSKEEIKKLFASRELKEKQINFSQIAAAARNWAIKEGREAIDKLDILLAIIDQTPEFKNLLFQKEIKESDLLNIIFWARTQLERDPRHFWEKPVETLGPGIAEFWMGGWTPETEKYAFDLTKHLRKGKVGSLLVGRDKEIQQVEEVLARSEKRNVLLLGAPGIGKTTVVHGLAEKSIRGLLPPALKYKRFLEIDVTALTAGAGEGELENRLQNLLTELTHAGNVIMFLPDIENLAGGMGTGVNITGHLTSSLGPGRLQVIATSTREAYRRHIEPQGTFAALFEPIDLEEPSENEAIRILEEATPKIEEKNKIIITYKAAQKTVELSNRYMPNRVLPGKAIDLLDEAATAISMKQKQVLEATDIEELVSQKTKTPVKAATGAEAEKLINLEKVLHQRIVDQEEAMVAVSNALRRARTIGRETKRPIGSFLFLGPTGVGKTETAKALAALYFGSEESIIRINMSEYQTANAINRLIGAPPGTGEYEEGGEFTEKVRQNPYALILLDEMEKAQQKVQEAFLPVLDEGIIEDVTGRKIIFTNTIIIATSNAGAEFIRESIKEQAPIENLKKTLLEKLQREGVFKPEFLNRFDDIVVYKPLSESEITQVVSLLIKELEGRLKKQDVSIAVDPTALEWIAKSGYDPTYGARPLHRFIADNLEEKIAEKILAGEIKRGSGIKISIQNNQLVFAT